MGQRKKQQKTGQGRIIPFHAFFVKPSVGFGVFRCSGIFLHLSYDEQHALTGIGVVQVLS